MPESPVYTTELRYGTSPYSLPSPVFNTVYYRLLPHPPEQSEYTDSSGWRVVLVSADTIENLAEALRKYTGMEVKIRSYPLHWTTDSSLQLCPEPEWALS